MTQGCCLHIINGPIQGFLNADQRDYNSFVLQLVLGCYFIKFLNRQPKEHGRAYHLNRLSAVNYGFLESSTSFPPSI